MIIAFSKLIGPVPIDCVLRESHESSLEITSNPVESGADINDHASVNSDKLTLEIGDSNPVATLNILKMFQKSRIPFFIVTGLTVYSSMLIKSIHAERDHKNSSILEAKVELQEVRIASTSFKEESPEGSSPTTEPGQPGGNQSTNAASPSADNAADPSTAENASSPVDSGSSLTETVPASQNQSLLSKMFS